MMSQKEKRDLRTMNLYNRFYDDDEYQQSILNYKPVNTKEVAMSFQAPVKSGVKRDLIPEDSYHAVCYSLFDLGTHEDEYMGEKKEIRKVMLTFEIPSLRIEYEKDGIQMEGPRVISKKYTWSMHEKSNLRKDMETWRGKSFTDLEAADFDFEQMPGVNGIIQIMHKQPEKGDKYAFIGSITKLMKDMKKLAPDNPKVFFTFVPPWVTGEGVTFPETMPEWVQKIIKESREYNIMVNEKELDVPDEPDIPTTHEAEHNEEPSPNTNPEDDNSDLLF